LDFVGAKLSGPLDGAFQFFLRYVDIRGGLYNDVGDMWYPEGTPPVFLGHNGMKLKHSAGYFFNVPTIFGINLRFSKGLFGKKGFDFWFGYNW